MSTVRAGDHSRRQLRRMTTLALTAMGTAAVLLVLGFWWWPSSLAALPIMVVVLRATDPGGLLDPIPHRKGIAGEVSVAGILEGLPRGYRVLNGVDTGHGNVDHVVIGATGIFAIETKNQRGRLAVQHGHLTKDGYDAQDLVDQAMAEALAVKDRLRGARPGEWVEAVIVWVQGGLEGGRIDMAHVSALDLSRLRSFITNRRVRMSDEEIEQAAAALGA